MNSLERYNAMLSGMPVDHLPRTPILMQLAAEHIGASFGAFCSDYRVKVEANLRCAVDFGVDLVGVMSDPYCETQGFGAEIIFHDHATPECPRPPLENSRDLDALPRPDPLCSMRMANTVRAVRSYHKSVAGKCPILGWVEGPAAEAADVRGVARFLIDIIDDPVWAGELMDLCVDVGIDFARAQVEAGADTIGIGDAIASQISPALYEEHILPRELRLSEAIRSMGAIVRVHICGNITHLLPGLATLPIDILDVDHMVDITRVREAMPDHVALGGNLDPVTDVLQATPEHVRHRIREVYLRVGNPFFVNAGCEIPPGTPAENLLALCEPIACRT